MLLADFLSMESSQIVTMAAVETSIGKVREHGQARKYSSKIHNRSDHLDAVQGAKGAKEAGEAGESTMSATVKKTRKKLMQREFAEAAAKKQAIWRWRRYLHHWQRQ